MIIILVTTWAPDDARAEVFLKSLRSWLRNLVFTEDFGIHVADDGSLLPGYPQSVSALDATKNLSFSRQERKGLGASWNAGIKMCHADVLFHAVDDWLLLDKLCIDPWIELLRKDASIGMIRLGPPHPGLSGDVELTEQGWIVRLHRHNYAFAFRPCLIHRRFFDAYGPFAEGCSALECERIYNEHFCRSSGPDIVMALPELWCPHPESISYSEIEP